MHTVPRGYLRAFADGSVGRKNPHVWRFERQRAEPKLLPISDVSVSTDIYTLWTEAGVPDTRIDKELFEKTVEDNFPKLAALLGSENKPSYWEWRWLSRFMAAQLVRTPRSLQFHRDACRRAGSETGRNDAQLAMIYMWPKLENWICQQHWSLLTNATECPFVTCDNPVTTWAERDGGAEIGTGFADPDFQLFFPITPWLGIAVSQTPESRYAIDNDTEDCSFTRPYKLSVRSARLPLKNVMRFNQITLCHADRYAYTNINDRRICAFVTDHFIDCPAPVRRFDMKQAGSPVSNEG